MPGFADPIVDGNGTLVINNVHSENYLAGVSGWYIGKDGFAEFLDLLVRGELRTGDTGQRVVINDSGAGGLIRLFSGDAQEVLPGFLLGFSNVFSNNDPWIDLGSADIGFGRVHWLLEPPRGSTDSGRIVLTTNATARGLLELESDVALLAPAMRAVSASDPAVVTTTSTGYVALSAASSGSMLYPPSGVVQVFLDATLQNSVAGNFAALSLEIRDTNAGGTLRVAAADAICASAQSGAVADGSPGSMSRVFSGLPTSGTMFFRAMGRSGAAANTASFIRPTITVVPQP